MSFSFSQMFGQLGLPAIIVATILLLMGLASLTVFIERAVTLRRSRTTAREFTTKIRSNMEAGNFDAVITEAEKHTRAHLARVIRAGLATYRHAQNTTDVSGLSPVERTERHMERYMVSIASDLRRGLTVLASVGSTAPFVGLLGTVLGIISAFQGIAATGSGGLSSVSAGISEALIETALGLSVAIPAVLAFNYLTGHILRDEMVLNGAAGEMLDTIEDWAERHAQARGQVGASKSVTQAAQARSATGYQTTMERARRPQVPA